jgi:DNA-binding transcriptional MerR regulator
MYSFSDVVILRVIKKLLDNGVSVAGMRSAFAGLRRRHPEFSSTSLPGALLVTDGRRVFLKRSRDVLEELTSGQLAFAFVVELGAVRRYLTARIGSVRSAQKREVRA